MSRVGREDLKEANSLMEQLDKLEKLRGKALEDGRSGDAARHNFNRKAVEGTLRNRLRRD